jgi:hypothetical protein
VWDIHDNFHIKLHTACNVQVPENYKNVVSILKISLFVLWKLNFFTALSDIEQNYMLSTTAPDKKRYITDSTVIFLTPWIK